MAKGATAKVNVTNKIDAAFDYIPDESNKKIIYSKEPQIVKVKPVTF